MTTLVRIVVLNINPAPSVFYPPIRGIGGWKQVKASLAF